MAERIAKDLAADERLLDDEETKETAFFRLESLGYRVGQGLAERCAHSSFQALSGFAAGNYIEETMPRRSYMLMSTFCITAGSPGIDRDSRITWISSNSCARTYG